MLTKNTNAVAKGEFIYRKHDEFRFSPAPPDKQPLLTYSWQQNSNENPLPITFAHFRCKGCSGNLPVKIEQEGQARYVLDCDGSNDHSLPLQDGKEHIYPILLDLLNYVQKETKHPVIITSGHRCPDHHLYVDARPNQQFSKHLIGAEVDFYVKDLEKEPEKIVALLQEYYQKNASYQGDEEYQKFTRWERGDSDVKTLPWINKEVFIKLYKSNEGRNLDNNHSHPYISIQVRYDRLRKEKVLYSWDKAHHGYFRH